MGRRLGGIRIGADSVGKEPEGRRRYPGGVTILAAAVLFVNAAFNGWAWPAFFRRVVRDPRSRDDTGRPTAFYRVHLVLLVIALGIAAASAVAGVLVLL